MTLVISILYTVIIEAFLQGFIESVNLRELGKSISHAEISSPNSLYFKAVKRAQLGSALVSLFIMHQYFKSLNKDTLRC